jgi:hypothetical protein
VGLIDDHEIERFAAPEETGDGFGAGKLAADEKDAWSFERIRARAADPCIDPEQGKQLVLPLADERLRYHDQQTSFSLGSKLRENKSGFDGLAEADLVGEDAASFGNSTEREHDGVDLVGIRIDSPLPLRRSCAGLFVGATAAYEVLRLVSPLDSVRHRMEIATKRSALDAGRDAPASQA